jgi:hypothetical protein
MACGAELWQFRSRNLVDPPPPALPDLSLAALGVTVVSTVGVSVALHASADFSPYLALL